MSLIVAPTASSSQPLAAAPAGTALPPSFKWLWAAVGVLGLSVVALGTTLVVQNAGSSKSAAADAQPVAAQAVPAQAEAVNSASKLAPAMVGQGGIAPNPVANRAPMPAPQQQPLSSEQAYAAAAQPQGAGPSDLQRTAARAPVCATCGRVESVQAVQQAAPATGVGAVAGGVLGAVVGNQIGKGSGRTAATVLGAVGGGYVGHKVEERTRTHTVYQVAVRMDDGSVRHFTRAQPTAVGTPVVLQGKGFRVDDGPVQRAEETYPRPQPGTVRVVNSY